MKKTLSKKTYITPQIAIYAISPNIMNGIAQSSPETEDDCVKGQVWESEDLWEDSNSDNTSFNSTSNKW